MLNLKTYHKKSVHQVPFFSAFQEGDFIEELLMGVEGGGDWSCESQKCDIIAK